MKETNIFYRSLKFMDFGTTHFRPPANVCAFMRKYVFLAILLSTFAFGVAFSITVALAVVAVLLFGDIAAAMGLWWFTAGTTVWAILLFAALFVLTVWTKTKIELYYYEKNHDDEGNRIYRKPKEPNVFFQWIKSKHDKICVKLTFTDADGKELEDPYEKEFREYKERRERLYASAEDADIDQPEF